jgi:hypothetical protein
MYSCYDILYFKKYFSRIHLIQDNKSSASYSTMRFQ